MDKYYCVKRDKNIDVDIYKVCQDCYLCETFKLVRERRSKQVPDLEILDRRITKIHEDLVDECTKRKRENKFKRILK